MLLPLILVQLWLAHAIAFFTHELSHSFFAFFLGWKKNPLCLHVPPLSAIVWVIQFGINQNVDYERIFASGHAVDAGLIGLAGPLLGNAIITYTLSRLAYAWARRRGHRGWGMLAFWICTASVGNFIDYVPIRTFTLEDDMGLVQRGFGWSPWTVLLILGLPTLFALGDFLLRVVPSSLRWLFPDALAQRYFTAVVTACFLFGFFGAAGLLEGGATSYRLSLISVSLCVPAAAVLNVLLSWNSKDPVR